MPRSWMIAAGIAVAALAWVLSGQVTSGPEPDGLAVGAPEASADPDGEAPGEAAGDRLARVRYATLEAETIDDTLIVQGRTRAERDVTVQSETGGRVAEVLAGRGDRLAAGAPIVRLAVDDREAALASAEALVAQRQIEYDAAARLNERGHAPDTEVAAARARLDQAIAQRRLAELEVERLVVRAPFAGVLDERLVELGDFVDRGDPVGRLVDLDPIRVVGQISERHLGRIAAGATASVALVTGERREGRVTYIGRSAQAGTRTFPVEVEIANPDGQVIDGVTAEMTLPLGQIRAHLVSPAVLSLADDGTLGVKLLDDQDRVIFSPVDLLASDPEGVWLGGLPARVRLITVGHEFVSPGQPVDPVEDTSFLLPDARPGHPLS